jgi:hypothetical protein
MKETTALAKVEERNKALADAGIDYGQDAQAFQDDFGKELAIPYLRVLQTNSPECTDGHAKRIADARPGMFYNSLTKKCYDGINVGISVVATHFVSTYLIFNTRANGGGFQGDVGLVDGEALLKTTNKNEKKHDILPNGKQLVKSNQHYILVVDKDGMFEEVLFPFASTQLKKSKGWNSLISGIKIRVGQQLLKAPMFYNAWNIKTVLETNTEGSWYGVTISPVGPTVETFGTAVYLGARSFREMITSGRVKVDLNDAGDADQSGAGSAAGKAAETDEEIPF